MKRKLTAEKQESADDDVANFLEDEESDADGNEPPVKRRKIDARRDKQDTEETEEEMRWMEDNPLITDTNNASMPEDNPFTQEELEEDWDEEAFMTKLSSYLEAKYNDDDYQDAGDHEESTNEEHGLSAEDLLTMDEDKLDELIPVNDKEVDHEFRYIPTFQAQSKDDTSTRRRTDNKKRRKQKSYYKVPTVMNKSKSGGKRKKRNKSGKRSRNVAQSKSKS